MVAREFFFRVVGPMLAGIFAALAMTPSVAAGAAQLDPTFGVGGISITASGSGRDEVHAAQAVIGLRNGKVLALSNSSGTTALVARYKSNGALDNTFGENGLVHTSRFFKGELNSGAGLDFAVNRSGAITYAGSTRRSYTQIDYLNCAVIGRLTPTGILDQEFGSNGRSRHCLRRSWWEGTTHVPTSGLRVRSMDLTGKGEILLGGESSNQGFAGRPFVARLMSNGRFDRRLTGDKVTRAGMNGVVELARTNADVGTSSVSEVRALRQGRVLAVGRKNGHFIVVRLDPDGGIDPTFGRRGTFQRDRLDDPLWRDSSAEAVAFDKRGRILVAVRYFDRDREMSRVVVFRLLRNGRPDRSFGKGGASRPELAAGFSPTGMALQHNGKIVVAGGQTGQGFALMRLDVRGQLDRSFFEDGIFSGREVPGKARALGSSALDVTFDRHGRILAAGGSGRGIALVRIDPR